MRVMKVRVDAHCEAMRLDVGTLRAVVALARAERLAPTGVARLAMVCGMRRAGHDQLPMAMPKGARGPRGEKDAPRLEVMRISSPERRALTAEVRKRGRNRMVALAALVAEGLPDVVDQMAHLRSAAMAAEKQRSEQERAAKAVAKAAAKTAAKAAAKAEAVDASGAGFVVRLPSEHPCFAPLVGQAAQTGEHPRTIAARALHAWLVSHGEHPSLFVGRSGEWSPDARVFTFTLPRCQVGAVDRVRARLRIGETHAVTAALAAHFGVRPGRHRVRRPGRHDLVVDILRPDGTPGEGTVTGPAPLNAERARRKAEAEARKALRESAARASDAAFLAERQRASGLPEEAVVTKPRRLLTPAEMLGHIVDAAARTGVTLPGATAGQTRGLADPDPSAPKDCRFCRRLPVASRERQTDKRAPEHRGAHDVGACVQCWEASRDFRVSSGLEPHGDVRARVAWLSERKGVTVREAAELARAAARAKGVAA